MVTNKASQIMPLTSHLPRAQEEPMDRRGSARREVRAESNRGYSTLQPRDVAEYRQYMTQQQNTNQVRVLALWFQKCLRSLVISIRETTVCRLLRIDVTCELFSVFVLLQHKIYFFVSLSQVVTPLCSKDRLPSTTRCMTMHYFTNWCPLRFKCICHHAIITWGNTLWNIK